MAFITFEEEETYLKAREKGKDGFEFDGITRKLKPAYEPTDIIWENLHSRRAVRRRRKVIVLIVAIGLLALIFWATYWIALHINNVLEVFPINPDCSVLVKTYGSHLEEWALSDYNIVK
jgi:hypothetical protein